MEEENKFNETQNVEGGYTLEEKCERYMMECENEHNTAYKLSRIVKLACEYYLTPDYVKSLVEQFDKVENTMQANELYDKISSELKKENERKITNTIDINPGCTNCFYLVKGLLPHCEATERNPVIHSSYDEFDNCDQFLDIDK